MDSNAWSSFQSLQEYAASLGISLNGGSTAFLAKPLVIEKKHIPNRIFIQPLECSDAAENGAPSDLTFRRYLRFAAGGAGLIWMESLSLLPELKSSPNQLVLTKQTLDDFKDLINKMKESAVRQNGEEPAIVVQLTHPGRSCFPLPKPAVNRESWDKLKDSQGQTAVTDDEIARLAESYGDVTKLAKAAGFDGVDIKACHYYFISELLSAYTREGRYGGSYENRVRHLKEALAASRAHTGNMFLTVRLNLYDGLPYPDGFGMKENGGFSSDTNEPLCLIGELMQEFGIELINCTSGSAHVALYPELSADNPLFAPPSHPFKSGARMHVLASKIKTHFPLLKAAATSFSQYRQYGALIGAGLAERGEADLIGFGRQALAYPDFANDILHRGEMDPSKVCICCDKCMRSIQKHKNAGCFVHDELYNAHQ